MPVAPLHLREAERLASLRSYQVLDTAADAALDALTAAAARALDAPAAVICLLDRDRLWFKSVVGLSALVGYEHHQVPRELSFAGHVVPGQVLVVPDATADPRFAGLPMVTGPEHLRAYAGAPVVGRDGLLLGALGVLDRSPREFDADAVQLLLDLAPTVAEVLELRRADAAAGLGGREVLTESHRLRAGIEAGELVVHYQPVVDLTTGRRVGVEALVRWDHPDRGLLPPDAFMPLAEASGLVVPLGRRVLVQACAQVARWRREVPGAGDLRVAVNVSGRQLSEPDVHEVVAEALTLSGLPPQALLVELTETCLAGPGVEVDIALQRIRSLGVHLSLDDFGTGYASFAYLQRFQPDTVKIDRCFVAALGRSERDDLLTRSLVELALRLGCDVVAEGVERREQAVALTRLGVRHAQGLLFSAARSGADLYEPVRPALT
ncbi:EAL domain-containing protein (putative c-di-GMP-specific phosphodiesterase class I) [Kineococcus radiotolerans]|uniref:EAL domain-containing protein (Putative c-di-GMP-specific phosphodiesterase class I) n=1 Tax=Kineococcus radiotolerans TaxID=131568 RepID=A0A7W4TJF0_KINRA|nr:EAL domain-containing protein [Kineococcus radiotolerans]MBB2899411.1 EAL domain-containing protein (putative c-di-GMP-specific phosphodiesterase class I) [Kineococcus radiotolerans]